MTINVARVPVTEETKELKQIMMDEALGKGMPIPVQSADFYTVSAGKASFLVGTRKDKVNDGSVRSIYAVRGTTDGVSVYTLNEENDAIVGAQVSIYENGICKKSRSVATDDLLPAVSSIIEAIEAVRTPHYTGVRGGISGKANASRDRN